MNVWVLTRRSCDEDVRASEDSPDIYLNKHDAYVDKCRESCELASELMKEFPGQDIRLRPDEVRTTVTRYDELGAVLERHIWTVWELEL